MQQPHNLPSESSPQKSIDDTVIQELVKKKSIQKNPYGLSHNQLSQKCPKGRVWPEWKAGGEFDLKSDCYLCIQYTPLRAVLYFEQGEEPGLPQKSETFCASYGVLGYLSDAITGPDDFYRILNILNNGLG
jgi:hypothetical protein